MLKSNRPTIRPPPEVELHRRVFFTLLVWSVQSFLPTAYLPLRILLTLCTDHGPRKAAMALADTDAAFGRPRCSNSFPSKMQSARRGLAQASGRSHSVPANMYLRKYQSCSPRCISIDMPDQELRAHGLGFATRSNTELNLPLLHFEMPNHFGTAHNA